MLTRISDSQSSAILSNAIDFKFFVTTQLHRQINDSVPVNRSSFGFLKLETKIEAFLFFSVSVQDIAFNEINQKIFGRQLKTDFMTFKKHLMNESRTNTKARRVLGEINKYFNQPVFRIRRITPKRASQIRRSGNNIFGIMDKIVEFDGSNISELMRWNPKIDKTSRRMKDGFYERYWDIQRSRLWLIRQLRNEITHSSLAMSAGSTTRAVYVLRFIHRQNNGSRQFCIEIDNPRNFFSDPLKDTKQFINEIRKIIT